MNEQPEIIAQVMMKVEWNQSSIWPRSSTSSRKPKMSAIRMNSYPVDLQSARRALAALAFEHLRLVHQPVHQEERENAERYVDEKDPVPGIIVGDPAADGRADGWRHDHGDAVDGEGLRTLPRREGVGQHGLFAGRHAAAAQALQNTENDQGASRLVASPHNSDAIVNSATQSM